MKELGQVAYEAFYDSAVSSQPLPAWGDQQAPILQAWRAAAAAVLAATYGMPSDATGRVAPGETVIPARVVKGFRKVAADNFLDSPPEDSR